MLPWKETAGNVTSTPLVPSHALSLQGSRGDASCSVFSSGASHLSWDKIGGLLEARVMFQCIGVLNTISVTSETGTVHDPTQELLSLNPVYFSVLPGRTEKSG